MANNMLIRTNRLSCKYRLAVYVRVVLFLAIPSVYLLVKSGDLPTVDTEAHDFEYPTGSFGGRHLLATLEKQYRNCTPAAILEFPNDGLTRFQRQHGYIVIHCLLAIYCFLLLGTVCDQYFVPAIEMICDRLEMEADIAGATFMAAASSSPELFINCVGTFVTEGDLGVGAVVGSAVFNVLAVPACCALFANRVIDLDWWSVSRDCMMYAVAVVALILTLLDDKVFWYEALVLVLMYTFYILAMVFNERMGHCVRSGCCYFNKPKVYTEITPLLNKDLGTSISILKKVKKQQQTITSIYIPHSHKEKQSAAKDSRRVSRSALRNDPELGVEMSRRHDSTGSDTSSSYVWSWPGEKSTFFGKVFWVVTWTSSLLLWLTIPDCRRRPRLYPLTFIMCVLWIGGVSYLVAWIITIFGDTLNLPDSITGLTILAAGTSLPEAVSSVLVTKQGHGTMGISNSIGSNTFDILLCLGLPWLIKGLFYPSFPDNHWVTINSSGLSYSAISLLSTLFTLYGCLALNKFQLDWKIGVTCMVVYVGYLTLAALIELNVFFVVNLPVCPH